MWLNYKHIAEVKPPVYKPIKNQDIMLDLKKGKNTIFIRMQNLGVRDTRNIIGLQLLGDYKDISVTLPDPNGTLFPVIEADKWLNTVTYKADKFIAAS